MFDVFQGKEKEWAKIIARAWVDEDFKEQLLASPDTVLKEYGIEFPEGFAVTMTEGKEKEVNLVLPPKPADISGSFEEIGERLQAANCCCGPGTCA